MLHQIKGEKSRKERESLLSVCEMSAFIWEIRLEQLNRHKNKSPHSFLLQI